MVAATVANPGGWCAWAWLARRWRQPRCAFCSSASSLLRRRLSRRRREAGWIPCTWNLPVAIGLELGLWKLVCRFVGTPRLRRREGSGAGRVRGATPADVPHREWCCRPRRPTLEVHKSNFCDGAISALGVSPAMASIALETKKDARVQGRNVQDFFANFVWGCFCKVPRPAVLWKCLGAFWTSLRCVRVCTLMFDII
jgi:hypothetical protein